MASITRFGLHNMFQPFNRMMFTTVESRQFGPQNESFAGILWMGPWGTIAFAARTRASSTQRFTKSATITFLVNPTNWTCATCAPHARHAPHARRSRFACVFQSSYEGRLEPQNESFIILLQTYIFESYVHAVLYGFHRLLRRIGVSVSADDAFYQFLQRFVKGRSKHDRPILPKCCSRQGRVAEKHENVIPIAMGSTFSGI